MLVDSKHKHLTMQEIIKVALHQTESEHSFKIAFLAIIKELTLPNNSVFPTTQKSGLNLDFSMFISKAEP